MSVVAADLTVLALEAGAAGCGVCDVAPFPEVEATLRSRIADGSNGAMAFTYRDPTAAARPASSFPWAKRLVVVAWPYLPKAGDPGPASPAMGRIARFATEDHYEGLRAVLDRVGDVLLDAGYRAEKIYDDSRLVDRAVAVRAGVGWWGKNTMVLAPGQGPWLLLGSVATDAALEISVPMVRDCGTCEACLPACPTGALTASGVLDARLCLAHILQDGGVIPRHLRLAVGDRIYGCDDCLTACPPGARLAEQSTTLVGRVDLYEMLALSDAELIERHAHFFVPGRRARYLRRNALVALANSTAPAHGTRLSDSAGSRHGTESREGTGLRGGTRSQAAGWAADPEGTTGAAVAVLAGYVGHSDWLLRLHAAWSLGRIRTKRARAVLEYAALREGHDQVRKEIEVALNAA